MLKCVYIFDSGNAEDLCAAFASQLPGRAAVQAITSWQALRLCLQRDAGQCLVVLRCSSKEDVIDPIGKIRRLDSAVPIVVVSDHGNVELASTVIKAGATDLLVSGEQLDARIATLLGKLRGLFEVFGQNRQLAERNAALQARLKARYRIASVSPVMRDLMQRVERVAEIPRPVLIVGERGTGKELIAHAIHTASETPGAMVTVNCALFNDSLLESELFGHEKGSFTGADHARSGKFEQADQGTLFLDEIGNMSLAFQQKILRVVEYGTFTRVGSNEERSTRARIIAATNADLRAKMDAGEFLADLYDRLTFEVLEIPPLRERPHDVEVLASFFLEEFAAEIPSLSGKTLSPETLELLRSYPFPGNVRELKNIIERAAYRDTTNEITPEDLGILTSTPTARRSGSFQMQVEALKARLVRAALRDAGGNQARAARLLSLTYDQFRHYFKKYGGDS